MTTFIISVISEMHVRYQFRKSGFITYHRKSTKLFSICYSKSWNKLRSKNIYRYWVSSQDEQ